MSPYIERNQQVIHVQPSSVGLEIRLADQRVFYVSIASGPRLDELKAILNRDVNGLEVLYMPNGMTPELWSSVKDVQQASKRFMDAIALLPGIRSQLEMSFAGLFGLPLLAYGRSRPLIYVGHPVDFFFGRVTPPKNCPPGRFAYNLFSEGSRLIKTWVDPVQKLVFFEQGDIPNHFH